jgi:NitT/TauT family transport system permease protein
MTVDAESGMDRATHVPAQKPTPPAIRRWRRLRSAAIVLMTQGAILAVLLGLWDHVTANNKQAAFMFGSPSAIAGFLGEMVRDGSLWRDTYVTGLETLLGFLVGNFVGTVIGLSLWYSRFVSRVVEPFVIALGSIPIIALAPIIIIWFGTGLISKVAMSTLSVVIVALVTSYKGAVGVDTDQINLMRTLGAFKFQIFLKHFQGGIAVHHSKGIRRFGRNDRAGAAFDFCGGQD